MSDSTTVLLVDDDLDCRTIYNRALSYAGYRVMEAATGMRAIDIARAVVPAVCIVDIGLPDVDGLEVTRVLRANPSTQRAFIVILTAYVSDFDRVQARQAGCDVYIGKPILPRDLVAVIDSATQDPVSPTTAGQSPESPVSVLSQSPPKHPAAV
jgi:two-component system, cell cycle response regulator DivK